MDFGDSLNQAHNPKVTGSSPVPATSKDKALQKCEAFFIAILLEYLLYSNEL